MGSNPGPLLMAEVGEKMLKLGADPVILNVDELGPALFNREGDWTSSQHYKSLAHDINKVQGFADYRYNAVLAHEPDPADSMAVSRHGNMMALVDVNLPRLPDKPLLGVFGGNRLVTLLQMAKQGIAKYEGTDEKIDVDSGNEKWRLAIQKGIRVKVFKWQDIEENMQDILKLMASDNKDSTIQLLDDELSIAHRLRVESDVPRIIPAGKFMDDLIIDAVEARSATQMNRESFVRLLSWANTTSKEVLAWVRLWQRFVCDPKVFSVEPDFFAWISTLPGELQMCRMSLIAWEYAADRQRECTVHGGRWLTGG